ncbi:putative DNA-directed RNA polymerase, partial [Daphnia magna]
QFHKKGKPWVSCGLISMLNLLVILLFFEGIPDEDIHFLVLNPEPGHPVEVIVV